MARFPKTLFVKQERGDGDTEYLTASKDVIDMADIGEKTTVGVYILSEVREVSSVVSQRRIGKR